MALVFTLLPSVAKQIDTLLKTKEDVLEIENAIKPAVLSIKTSKDPSPDDVFYVGHLLARSISSTSWVKRNAASANQLIRYLTHGIGVRDAWRRAAVNGGCLNTEPFAYISQHAYSFYQKVVEAGVTPMPALTASSSSSSPSSMTTSSERKKHQKKSSSADANPPPTIKESTLDSVLTLTGPPSSDLDNLFADSKKKK